MRAIATIGLLFLLCACALGQILEVKGGDSTLMQSTGGDVKAYFGSSTSEAGVGFAGGQMRFGFGEQLTFHKWDVFAGDRVIPFALPTDFNPAYFGFMARGIEASREWQKSDLTVFTGSTATMYETPFFSSASSEQFTSLLFYKRKLS